MARINYVKSFRGTTKTVDGTLGCGRCGKTIAKGDPYRWWANKVGRSSIKKVRCMDSVCAPRRSEYLTTSHHLGALYDAEDSVGEELAAWGRSPAEAELSDAEEIAQTAADAVREVSEGYQESADNIADGFGHETSTSEELAEKAEALESAASELESVYFEDKPERAEGDDEDKDAVEVYEQELVDWAEDVVEKVDAAFQEVW